MADFTHESNYTEETSFSKVVFGSSAPVLEVELNELQEITDTKIKRIHDTIGKCIYVKGAITPHVSGSGFTWNVKVTDCILIFNGVSVYIDSITSPNATVIEGANVYFTVFKSRVTGSTSLKKYGNYTDGASIENPIYDSRIGSETSQRVQVKVGLSISSSATPDDTSTNLYFQLGTIFNGFFVRDTGVLFNKTILDSINDLSTNKLSTSAFTLSNIIGTLSISKGGTGATNKLNAMRNIIYTTIASGDSVDLNSYTSQGIKCFTSTVPATNNIPTGSTGVGMLVVDSVDIHNLCQVWIELSGSKTSTFKRTRISDTWSSWGKIYSTNDDVNYSTPTPLNNCTVSNCHIYKRSGWVQLTGYITVQPTTTTASTIQAGQVADEFLPFETSRGVAYHNLGNGTFKVHPIEVHTTGKIQVQEIVGVESGSSYATQNIFLSICYPAKNG